MSANLQTTNVVDYHKGLPVHIRKIMIEYAKPLIHNRFHIHREFLKNHKNTKKIEFDNNRWDRRPYLYCYDKYSPDYQYSYPVIMTLNQINSIHSFIQENFQDRLIITPSLDDIIEVLSMKGY